MNDRGMPTYFSYLLAVVLQVLVLASCAPKTDEERIDSINKRISPEGHLTKTHLYIDWPAEYESGKEVAKPLKLKIPIEYLGQNLITFDNAAKIEQHDLGKTDSKKSLVIDYSSRINEALSIHDNKITMIYLRLLPEAKPYQPMLPYKSDTKEVEDFKYNHFNSSYAVIISRHKSITQNVFNQLLRGTQEADIAGLKRYVETECYDIEELKTHSSTADQKTLNVDLQRALDNIASKAKDDHSPENCYENRALQHLTTAVETPFDKAVFVRCSSTGCDANFGLRAKNEDISARDVSILISKENTMYQYEDKIAHTEPYTKAYAEARASNTVMTYIAIPQPLLNTIFTDLSKWREKVDPTRSLLSNFVIDDPKKPES